jgi:hypothetical protein
MRCSLTHRLVYLVVAASVTVGAASRAQAEPVTLPAWHTTTGSYLALGQGGGVGGPASLSSGAYKASGIDAHGLSQQGHGGFFRFEQGDTSWLAAIAQAQSTHVVALDLGYTYGGPILGDWANDHLLGFLEVGLSGWQTRLGSFEEARRLSGSASSASGGFGLAFGATVQARYGVARLGLAVQRREIPFFVGQQERYASSMTVHLRLGLEL